MLKEQKNKNNPDKNVCSDFQLKILSNLRRNSQKGSTLAVGLALGALMIGGTAIAISLSSQNKTNVTAQEQTAQAVAAAEAGVARIQALLLKYPMLAENNSNEWVEKLMSEESAVENNRQNIVISDTSLLGIQNGNLIAISPFSTSNSFLIANNGNGNNKNNKKQNNNDSENDNDMDIGAGVACVDFPNSEVDVVDTELTSDDIKQIKEDFTVSDDKLTGKTPNGATFQLVEYQPPGSDDIATLQVRGEYEGSQAQLEVKFAVVLPKEGTPLPEDFPEAAGFWFQQFHVNGGGNQTINFDILDSSGCVDDGIAWSEPPSGAFKHNGDHIQFNQKFPPLPNLGESENKYEIAEDLTTISSGNCTLTSPLSSYKYTGGCGSKITVDISGGKNVTIYSDVAVPTVQVTGLDSNPGKVIVYSNNGLNFGSSAPLNNANQWKHIQYYVASGDIETNGNLTSSGFIFAPNSSFHINGGGNGTHTGPIWAKSYHTNGGGSSTLNPSLSRADFEYLELFDTSSYSIEPPQNYVRVPVSD